MYESPMEKELSPAFWEIEDKSPRDWKGFGGIVPGLEHALGKENYFLFAFANSRNRPAFIYHWRC